SDTSHESSLSRSPSPSPTVPLLSSDSEGNDDAPQSELLDDETQIIGINGHRWKMNNLEFMVAWADGDVTWEPLSNVNDCQGLDEYLDFRAALDPLQLSKRRYVINKELRALNE
ncbi:unnamed protein product, partial [Mycena citricolor]